MHAGDYRRTARQRLAGHWPLSVGVAVVASLLGGSLIHISIDLNTTRFFSEELTPLVLRLLNFTNSLAVAQFILGGVVSVGHSRYLLRQHDELPLEFSTLFSFFDRFGQVFLMRLLKDLIIFLGTLLLIIPGVIASYGYAMAPFIMADDPDISARDALRMSREKMRGHKWELFRLDLSFIGWELLCVPTLGIGRLFLVPYRRAARAAFYRQIVTPWVL